MIKITEKIKLYNEDNIETFKRLNDESVDVILTDPPYLYLKKQKIEREFDEQLFFSECKRVLKNDGFVILFGRGTSFYRWNTILADLGFVFKEEVIWDKRLSTSPLLPLLRIHETISIHTKKSGTINRSLINYIEHRKFDVDKIIGDIKRIRVILNNPKELKEVQDFLKNGKMSFYKNKKITNFNVTVGGGVLDSSRCANVMQSLTNGIVEQSIIKELRDHYSTIHPTQKPVRLIERLLNLVVKNKNAVVFDPFAGSCPVAVACHNLELNFIGCEIDKEYFDNAVERLKVECSQLKINY